MPDTPSFLSTVSLFQSLPEAEFQRLSALFERRTYPRHAVIFREGEPGDALYIIKEGLVKVSKASAGGRLKTLAILKPGEVFGEMGVLSDVGRSATVEVMADATLLVLGKEQALDLLKKTPEISLAIIRTLIERLAAADRHIKSLALGDSRARVADVLLLLAENFASGAHSGARVSVKLTHQEIADLAGLARETTTKLLNEFVKEDAITLADREIEIMDVDKLRAWVG